MRIRVLGESDIDLYFAVRLRGLKTNPEAYGSTYEREVQFTPDEKASRIRATDNKFVLGAFNNVGSLIGIVTFVRNEGSKDRHKGNVFGMYVVPESRGQGVGKALVRELLENVGQLPGLEQLHLAVVADNAPAKALYLSLGFKTYGVEPNALLHEGRYYDEELMVYKC
ncbi:MAG: GNAT family N-acetyltransferase [Thermaerobacter sp.]|nr:GNAT family N-acetyltransferase [Thermaerobacter sp.]